jgi:hypothetical protein
MISATTSEAPMRELCSRAGDGIEVTLLWRPAADELCVAVVDTRLNHSFHIPVAPAEAMRAFRHPYPHAAGLGLLNREPALAGAR